VIAIVNGGLAQLGYNQLSLFDNPLPNMELLPGQIYTSTNTYGWTEFNIDAVTHQVDVKTWGSFPTHKLSSMRTPPRSLAAPR
jgi:3-phytase/alkaline phosphatase D